MMDEHILFGVAPVDESVARLDVEPLDSARDLGGHHLLGQLVFGGTLVAADTATGAAIIRGEIVVVVVVHAGSIVVVIGHGRVGRGWRRG